MIVEESSAIRETLLTWACVKAGVRLEENHQTQATLNFHYSWCEWNFFFYYYRIDCVMHQFPSNQPHSHQGLLCASESRNPSNPALLQMWSLVWLVNHIWVPKTLLNSLGLFTNRTPTLPLSLWILHFIKSPFPGWACTKHMYPSKSTILVGVCVCVAGRCLQYTYSEVPSMIWHFQSRSPLSLHNQLCQLSHLASQALLWRRAKRVAHAAVGPNSQQKFSFGMSFAPFCTSKAIHQWEAWNSVHIENNKW